MYNFLSVQIKLYFFFKKEKGTFGETYVLGAQVPRNYSPAVCHALVLPEPRILAKGAGLTQEAVLAVTPCTQTETSYSLSVPLPSLRAGS